MRDIARKIGVSHVTVSLALRDHPRISAAMRRKVREVAEEIGYRPDPRLTALANYRKGKSETSTPAGIAWINAWPDPSKLRSYREFDLYWKGASAAAEKYGYRLEEFRLGEDYPPQRLHRVLSTRGIRGLLLPPQDPQPEWDDFPWSGYSVVRAGSPLQSPRCHLVTADHLANMMLAFEKIRERGYKRIGFVTDGRETPRGHLVESGYRTARRLVDESDRVPVLVMNAFQQAEHQEVLAAWLANHKADAILTNMAGLPAMLESIGLRVPEDVALAATTVLDVDVDAGIDPHPEEIGRVGFLMLNSLINDGAHGIPAIFRQTLVEGSWVDGESLPDRGGS